MLKDEWPQIDGLENSYGVCDSPDQFMEKYEKLLDSSDRSFVVSMTQVLKKNPSPEGGWRWHRGPYVGKNKPQCEYLYDEPEINEAWCLHVLEVN